MKKDDIAQKRRSIKHPGNVQDTHAPKAGAEEWKNKYLRALADYQNLEKRHVREQAEKIRQANSGLLRRLIPVADMLELAQKHLEDPGLDIAIREWGKVLSQEGVERIQAVGRPFDPSVMECVEVTEGDGEGVTEEVLSGYLLGATLLRPAKVKVGIKKGAEGS